MTEQSISASLGQYEASVDGALADMTVNRVIPRIWAHDYTLWKPEPTEISDRLGWLHIAEVMKENIGRMEVLAEAIRVSGYTNPLLLGMGGSSLASELFCDVFCEYNVEYSELVVLDSTDPGAVLACAEDPNLKHELFIVSTKSGGTVETLSLFKFFYNRIADTVGIDHAGEHFIAITDPGSGLEDRAKRYKFRDIFLNDPNIGGRYSALSYFGLVPAMLVGVEVTKLLGRATDMMRDCRAEDDNPGAWLGAVMGTLAINGRDKLTLVISPSIVAFGNWVEQLIAESTGKEGKGILPVNGEALGEPGVYGDDRFFVYLRLHDDDAHDASVQKLIDAGQPVVQINLRDPYDLGGEYFRWEMATAVAGHLLGINPFNQPNVESAKVLAREMVTAYQKEGRLPDMPSKVEDDGITAYAIVNGDSLEDIFDSFLKQTNPGDYIAIQAYIQPTPETDAALQELRIRLRDQLKVATTLGYGPRFLHSTGQLHKGDAGNGLFIQITADDQRDAPIPDEAGAAASSISFGVLKSAQALGDLKALLNAWRRVIGFHLGTDAIAGIERLTKSLEVRSS